ncbi:fatty acid alpha-hydroxylase [Spizellomyces punctatus DAOM BR117]|uniref:Fatty acid hydroxylase domain-containing protein n=1 Tax=Spizellomyces punctatus (strain DAOM BR117) TaxID=645134 RepID=A0A0L0HAA3_SPIPD|nr:fatty acid alpha-hydroxylase [Spizellomyces punctatus DAOM BR117]KNC98077.1 hypothetical protein SPPG_06489 [Spizellomyces punctatus DAOM BR117]|eukprot:XP_016606117.1 hypothetical protein SPPG_06489 [Spizellomyces punctatus DAOM BR117]
MKDELEHLHSDAAYDMLETYFIGDLATDGSAQKPIVPLESDKNTSTLGKKEAFIDVRQPMLAQVWTKNFKKDVYMKQVHIPRHVNYSAPIFGHPALEMFTKTPWWVVPLVWTPLWATCVYYAIGAVSLAGTLMLAPIGLLIWTIIEYTLHRFLFHVDDILPDNRYALTAHFLLHGIHHYLPMDRMRLVMPPALSLFLAVWIWTFFNSFLPTPIVLGLATGTIPGYVGYDLIHYYLHHGRPFAAHLREMKTYHLDHHYKDANLGYGITSKLWDRVFGTVLY